MESVCYNSIKNIQSTYDYDRASPAGSGSVRRNFFRAAGLRMRE